MCVSVSNSVPSATPSPRGEQRQQDQDGIVSDPSLPPREQVTTSSIPPFGQVRFCDVTYISRKTGSNLSTFRFKFLSNVYVWGSVEMSI